MKGSTNQEREKDQIVQKLKDFLTYLEDKNLINSKIQDTKKLRGIVDQLLAKENKMGHFYANRRKSNPVNESYNFGKGFKKKASYDSKLKTKKLPNRLIFQQSRSERNSGERKGSNLGKKKGTRRSLGNAKKSTNTSKNFTPSKVKVKIYRVSNS